MQPVGIDPLVAPDYPIFHILYKNGTAEGAAPPSAKRSPMNSPLNTLSVTELRKGMADGAFSAAEVMEACLARIAAREPELKAWISLDEDGAMAAARKAGTARALDGIPFGVKDVFSTATLPTQMGSSLYAGNQSRFDAAAVGLLRQAGAIVIGKTATAEFAGTAPAETRNPLNAMHTPGGSSSGSAAAVADHMVPFALGTQTGGSVIRPAAFCGVVGFKPSFGIYPVDGMKLAAQSFDTVGLFTRSAEDAALLHSVFMPGLSAETPGPFRIGVLETHLQGTLAPGTMEAVAAATAALEDAGCSVTPVAAPGWLRELTAHRAVVNAFERRGALAAEAFEHLDGFRQETKKTWDAGQKVTGDAYLDARRAVDAARIAAAGLFADVDILLMPATPDEAPEGLHATGDPRLQELWTTLHLPSLCLPVGHGPTGLPLSIQFVAPLYRDAHLLAAAIEAERILKQHTL